MRYTIEQDGDLCSIQREDGAKISPARRARLGQALVTHGFVQEDYDTVCRQLNETCRVTIDVPVPVRWHQL